MAISAAITLTSAAGDLLTDALALSTSTSLSIAGSATAISQTTGLARKTTATVGSTALIDSIVLYRADDYTDDGANKVYIKNISTTPAEYITVYLTGDRGGETHTPANALTELGRLYAGDWAFFPWNATAGTKEVATCEITGTWAAGDSIEFDGVTIVSPGSGKNELATAMDAAHYPNWTTTVSTATVTFTSRQSRADLEIDTDEFTIVDLAGSNATITVATGTDGKKSASDIYIKPSVETGITVESMLFYQ